jgi:hypothetical protein
MKKLTYDEVKQYFQDQNCELLELEYKNSKQKLKYRCKCGEISYTVFERFKLGKYCKSCGINKRSKTRTYTYEYVSNYFKECGCELMETEYINAKQKLQYKCSCKNISYINFNNFKQGNRCIKCRGEHSSKLYAHSYDFIKNEFEKHNCELLETEYINAHTKMKYKCSCGNISSIIWNSFNRGTRCMNCLIKTRTGETSSNWNSDRDCINRKIKLRNLSCSYVYNYRKKYNIIGKKLHVDHIFPVKAFTDHNIWDLDIINCEDNLQILSAHENLSKHDKYDKEEFLKYLEEKGIKISV